MPDELIQEGTKIVLRRKRRKKNNIVAHSKGQEIVLKRQANKCLLQKSIQSKERDKKDFQTKKANQSLSEELNQYLASGKNN